MSQKYKTEPTEFRNVYKRIYEKGKVCFSAQFKRHHGGITESTSKTYDNIREAAIAVDKYLISQGKEPVNILVKK